MPELAGCRAFIDSKNFSEDTPQKTKLAELTFHEIELY